MRPFGAGEQGADDEDDEDEEDEGEAAEKEEASEARGSGESAAAARARKLDDKRRRKKENAREKQRRALEEDALLQDRIREVEEVKLRQLIEACEAARREAEAADKAARHKAEAEAAAAAEATAEAEKAPSPNCRRSLSRSKSASSRADGPHPACSRPWRCGDHSPSWLPCDAASAATPRRTTLCRRLCRRLSRRLHRPASRRMQSKVPVATRPPKSTARTMLTGLTRVCSVRCVRRRDGRGRSCSQLAFAGVLQPPLCRTREQ